MNLTGAQERASRTCATGTSTFPSSRASQGPAGAAPPGESGRRVTALRLAAVRPPEVVLAAVHELTDSGRMVNICDNAPVLRDKAPVLL
jgi:hypothetical protein